MRVFIPGSGTRKIRIAYRGRLKFKLITKIGPPHDRKKAKRVPAKRRNDKIFNKRRNETDCNISLHLYLFNPHNKRAVVTKKKKKWPMVYD